MLTIAIILCYLLGVSLLLVISRKYSLAELIGYSFLTGIMFETFFMFFLDIINVRFTPSLLIALNVFSIIAINGANYKNLLALKSEWKMPAFELSKINLVSLFIFCLIAYLFYVVTVKCLFWPPSAHDAIGSFDKLGRIMALEGKIKISLFDYNLEGAGGVYPPLFQGCFAYVYLFGAETSKFTTTLFFLSLLTTFFSLLKNYVGQTAAMLFTFILMITPELFSHAALSLDNMPTTAYVCAGALSTFIWLDNRNPKYFWLGALMMAGVIWIRGDTIVFTAAALLVMGIDFLRTRDFRRLAVYSAIAVAPFVMWTLYLKMKIHYVQAARLDLGMGYNSARMDLMTGYVKAYLFGGQHGAVDGGQLYGISFILFFVVILVNIALIYKVGWKKILNDKFYPLIFLVGSFVMYFAVFYFINEKTQNSPIASLMESSFKRGLFCFIPLALFYSATSYGPKWAFEKLEKFRNPTG